MMMASRLDNFAPVGSLLDKTRRRRVRPAGPGQREPSLADRAHLQAIRKLPCLLCCKPAPSDAAHIRMASRPYGKKITGIGQKPDDRWTVPLCAEHHVLGKDAQHSRGERRWWAAKRIDPLAVASALYRVSGDHDEMLKALIGGNR